MSRVFLLAALISAAPAWAVDVTMPSRFNEKQILACTVGGAGGFGTGENGVAGTLRINWNAGTMAVDATADNVVCTAQTLSFSVPDTVRKHRLITTPANFPADPIESEWTVSVDFDAVSATPTVATFVPSNLQFMRSQLWAAQPKATLSIPSTFVISGSYTITGPSSTVGPTAFSQTFTRDIESPSTVEATCVLEVETGSTWPATASAKGAWGAMHAVMVYNAASTALYSGTVDGHPVTLTWAPQVYLP